MAFHLAAATIAAIYQKRRQVELFFTAITHNLKIKTFLETSENAVMTPIQLALITTCLPQKGAQETGPMFRISPHSVTS
jgi:putative transposase